MKYKIIQKKKGFVIKKKVLCFWLTVKYPIPFNDIQTLWDEFWWTPHTRIITVTKYHQYFETEQMAQYYLSNLSKEYFDSLPFT